MTTRPLRGGWGQTLIRAVLLDALGTLVELRSPWPALVEELAARGAVVSVEEARGALKAEMAYYRAHHDEASDPERLDDLRDRCTEVLRDALPERAREVEDLRGALLGALRFAAYPEVPGVLEELGRCGVVRVVVSNWDVSLREVLERTGLAGLVDGAVISAEAGVAKPDPEIFHRALSVAGVGAAEAVHVGDTAEVDAAGAIAAGIAAVHLDRGGNPLVASSPAPIPSLAAVPTVASLAEIPALVGCKDR